MDNNAPAEGVDPYTYGATWAQHWVNVAKAEAALPTKWWLDVEGPCGTQFVVWQCGASGLASNAAVVQGAVDTLRADGLTVGIYSTWLQWPAIVGNLKFPDIPIWIAGATSKADEAVLCTSPAYRFAGGIPTLAQWTYNTPSGLDEDYAC